MLAGLVICAILCVMGARLQAEESSISLTVSCTPQLPVKNLMPQLLRNWNFHDGLKGWGKAKDKKSIMVVPGRLPGRKSLCVDGYTAQVWAVIPLSRFDVGKSYVTSCMIKHNSSHGTTLGMSLNFWDSMWQGVGGSSARGDGPSDTWVRVIGKPYEIPRQARNCQLNVGMGYASGGGCVDELCIQEAYATMTIHVSAPTAIRQVKMICDNGRVFFDTDVMSHSSRTYSKQLRVETPYTYTIMVVTNDGDVKTLVYPPK